MAKQTINSLPGSDANFMSDLQSFLADEIADREQLKASYANMISSGGIGAVDVSLTHTISTVIAFVNGYYVTDASISHTYTATKDTYVYLRDDDSRVIAITGYTIIYDGNFVFAEYDSGTGSTQPTTPTGCTPLFLAITDGTSITTVNDLRRFKPIDVYRPEWYGADPTGTTDSSDAILRCLVDANGKLVLFSGTYKTEALKGTYIDFNINIDGQNNTTFEGGDADTGFFISGSIDYFIVKGIKFNEFGSRIVTLDANSIVIGRVLMDGNHIVDGAGGAAFHCRVMDGIFTNNLVENISFNLAAHGITFGYGVYADQDLQGRYVVSNNIFRNIESTVSNEESHAIYLYGYQATVTGNVIEDISNGGASNSEGIYVKCKYGVINGNSLKDAGADEGMINVKGEPRDETADMQGYDIIVTNNTVISTLATNQKGIHIQTSDVLCVDNIIDGPFVDACIFVDADAGDSLTISRNQMSYVYGTYGIYIQCDADDLIIKDNIITHIVGTAGIQTIGIYLRPTNSTDFSDIEVSGNHINDNSEYVGITGYAGIYSYIPSTTDLIRAAFCNNVIHLNVSGINAIGLGFYAPSGATIQNLSVIGNICDVTASGATALPFLLNNTSEDQVSEVFIQNNKFYDSIAITGTTDVEFHHNNLVFTNTGATAAAKGQLPPAIPGLEYWFIRVASYAFRVAPDGTEVVRGGTAGQYLQLDADYDNVHVRCVTAGVWEIVGGIGTYSYA